MSIREVFNKTTLQGIIIIYRPILRALLYHENRRLSTRKKIAKFNYLLKASDGLRVRQSIGVASAFCFKRLIQFRLNNKKDGVRTETVFEYVMIISLRIFCFPKSLILRGFLEFLLLVCYLRRIADHNYTG